MQNQKLINYIGLAKRAGCIVIGKPLKTSLSKKQIDLLIIATDANVKVKKELLYLAKETNTRVVEYETVINLGQIVGAKSINSFGIISVNFANIIEVNMKEVE